MSLGPTFVKADDGKFYRDPTIRGEDYFICFDEDDPPELVIRAKRRSLDQLKIIADKILETLNIKADLHSHSFAERVFSKGFKSNKFKPAIAFFLDIKSSISASLFQKENEGIRNDSKCEGTYYDFSKGELHERSTSC